MVEIGDNFERKYVIRELLGAGGFALVYRAEQPEVGRSVALKIIRSAEEIGTHPKTLLKRFQREARMAAELRHPSNIQLFDFGTTEDDQLYMIFEFIDGIPLDDLIRSTGPMPVRRVVHILKQLLEALDEAHQLGILHRDVKPANVMIFERLGKKDRAKMIDYGIAKPMGKKEAEGTGITAEGHVVGTPRYMAPEQILMLGELSPATDIYSLGLVAYEMLAGEALLGKSTHTEVIKRQLSGEVFRVPPSAPAPPGLRAVVDKMLAKSAKNRFQRADQVLAALERVDLNEAYDVRPPVQKMLQEIRDASSEEMLGSGSYGPDSTAEAHAPTLDSQPMIRRPDAEFLDPEDRTVDSKPFRPPSQPFPGTEAPPTMDRSHQALLAAAQDRPEPGRSVSLRTVLVILTVFGLLAVGGLAFVFMQPDQAKDLAYTMRDTVKTASSACQDDEHEPNNRSSQATELTGVSRSAVLCPKDVDWYKLGYYDEGALVKVGTEYGEGAYDIDLELYVDADFEVGAYTPKKIETIERRISKAGNVVARVYYPTVEGDKGRTYTITRDIEALKEKAGDDAGEAKGRVFHVGRDDIAKFEYLEDPETMQLAGTRRWEKVPEAVRSAVLVTYAGQDLLPGHLLATDLNQVGDKGRLTVEEISVGEWTSRLGKLASEQKEHDAPEPEPPAAEPTDAPSD